jgi:hypothetical protein
LRDAAGEEASPAAGSASPEPGQQLPMAAGWAAVRARCWGMRSRRGGGGEGRRGIL